MGDSGCIIGVGVETYTPESDPAEATDDVTDVRSKGKAISLEDPLDGDNPESDAALHDRP